MDEIYSYLDYREFLRTYYEERKTHRRSFSYRIFAESLGLDQSHLAKILMGQLHITPELIPAVQKYFAWESNAAEYFAGLVAFGRASNPAEAKVWFDRLESIRPTQYRCLAAEQLEYFRHWYTPAVRSILAFHPKATVQQIAALLSPQPTFTEIDESLTLLCKLELIHKEPDGYKVLDTHVGTPQNILSPFVRQYHHQCIGLAQEALERIPQEDRDITALVAGLDQEAFDDLRSMVREFRLSVQKRVAQVQNADRVVQVNFQIFPLTNLNVE